MKEKLMEQIRNYIPCNAQEEADRRLFLSWLERDEDISRRENLSAHLTASAWVVTRDRSKVLMAYHNLYDSWAWLGGHADGSWDLQAVACREALEESGISQVLPLGDKPISLEILTVSGHEKKGHYVSSHLHLNLTYLFEAEETEALRIRPGENSAVAWIPREEIKIRSSEPWFVERIYSKLIEKSATI